MRRSSRCPGQGRPVMHRHGPSGQSGTDGYAADRTPLHPRPAPPAGSSAPLGAPRTHLDSPGLETWQLLPPALENLLRQRMLRRLPHRPPQRHLRPALGGAGGGASPAPHLAPDEVFVQPGRQQVVCGGGRGGQLQASLQADPAPAPRTGLQARSPALASHRVMRRSAGVAAWLGSRPSEMMVTPPPAQAGHRRGAWVGRRTGGLPACGGCSVGGAVRAGLRSCPCATCRPPA